MRVIIHAQIKNWLNRRTEAYFHAQLALLYKDSRLWSQSLHRAQADASQQWISKTWSDLEDLWSHNAKRNRHLEQQQRKLFYQKSTVILRSDGGKCCDHRFDSRWRSLDEEFQRVCCSPCSNFKPAQALSHPSSRYFLLRRCRPGLVPSAWPTDISTSRAWTGLELPTPTNNNNRR